MPLAVVPLVFSIQQFCEGWVWIGLHRGDPTLLRVFGVLYLFFALFFWPVWIPFSTFSMESRKNMKVPLGAITFLGVILGGCLFLPILLNPDWLTVEIVGHAINYETGASPILSALPTFAWQLFYLAIVAVPLFVSPVWRALHFGMAVVLSAALSRVLFPYAAASVWCFFAAALSLYLSGLFFALPALRPAERGVRE